jgi:ATP-dependent DNA helicase RecG
MADSKQLDMFEQERDHIGTWSPREIWLRLDATNVKDFSEDSRIERKSAPKAESERDMAEYYSMWSNTVDGGIILLGVSDSGDLEGVAGRISQDKINRLEALHTQFCPDARPEFKRIGVRINEVSDFVISIFLPYRGFLVETNKGEALIRRGSTKHKMMPEEKDDFRSTRHERSWEQRTSHLVYPGDLDTNIVQSLADNFRQIEAKPDWSNEDVLIDRNLLVEEDGKLHVTNALVLVASKSPRKAIPGVRVRIQRFPGAEEGAGNSFQPIRDVYAEGAIPTILDKAGQIIDSLNYNVTWLNKE